MGAHEIISTIIHDFHYALYGSILVGMICAFLGVYIVARRVVFLGAVLTQVSVLGIAITFLPFIEISHTLGSLIITLTLVVVLSRFLTGKRIPKDAVLGGVFVTAIALRALILQKTPKVEVAEIENLLRGDILFVTPALFHLMGAVFTLALVIHLLFFKEFSYISFDADTAATQGFNVSRWEIAFYLIAAAVISVATHMVGDMFVFGFLVIPAVAAMLLVRSVKSIFAVAVLIGALAPVAGLFLAFKYDFPSSPAIVAVAATILVLAQAVRFFKGG
ncbi:MAG: metal ABC transporter permease [bacterium]